MIKDDFGDRMKRYENTFRYYLLPREPVIIRLDGAHFHTFLKHFRKPFDEVFSDCMCKTMEGLCRNVPGCVLGYTQSDEITLVLINDTNINTQTWFDGNLNKIVSTSAAMATLFFNKALKEVEYSGGLADVYKKAAEIGATFDSRAFNIPKEEVTNAVYWRQKDALRNSVNMMGFANFPTETMDGKSVEQVKEMLDLINCSWSKIPVKFQRGICCIKDKDGKWFIDYKIPIFLGDDRSYIENLLEGK